jgi:MoaA/NifB/PqqE/SkfB family radical SAM enzyme
MLALGCSIGYFVEYVPCGENKRYDLVMNHGVRALFRKKVLDLRQRKRLVLIHFPDDEYGKENRCSAAGRASLHINSQGDIEPCPFVSISCDNIRNGGLRVAFESKLLRKIREHPDLLKRDKFACALFEHKKEIEKLSLKK